MDLPGKNSPRRGIVAVILAAADRIVKVNLAHTVIFPTTEFRVDSAALTHAEKVHAAFGANHVARRWRDPVSRRPHRLRALIPPAGWRRPNAHRRRIQATCRSKTQTRPIATSTCACRKYSAHIYRSDARRRQAVETLKMTMRNSAIYTILHV